MPINELAGCAYAFIGRGRIGSIVVYGITDPRTPLTSSTAHAGAPSNVR